MKATAEKHIMYMKTSVHLVFLRSEQPVCENKCKLRETKGLDIAKMNSGHHVCLPQGGTNVVAPY